MAGDGDTARVEGWGTSHGAVGGTQRWERLKESAVREGQSDGGYTIERSGCPHQALVLAAAKVGAVILVRLTIPLADSKVPSHAGSELCPQLNQTEGAGSNPEIDAAKIGDVVHGADSGQGIKLLHHLHRKQSDGSQTVDRHQHDESQNLQKK